MSIKKKEKIIKKQESNVFSNLKKKPGFLITSIGFIILCVMVFFSHPVNLNDSLLEGGYAKSIHENNQAMIDYYLEGVDAQITGQYDYTINDDQLFSMRNDFLWLKNKENEIYSSKPSSDVLVKEMAFSYFTEEIATINQDFLYDFDYPNQSETIATAQNTVYSNKTTFSQEVEDIFFEEAKRKEVFTSTYNDLMREYVTTKLTLLNSDTGTERKYVESIKVILATKSN